MKAFKVYQRDIDHWDIYADRKRVFTIRGAPGCIALDNEQTGERLTVRSVQAAMSFVCDKIMFTHRPEKESASAGDALSVAAERLKATVKELQEVVDKLERP